MNETIKRIQNGEKELLSDLIIDNLNYIYKYIKKYNGLFLDYEDLKQEAVKEFINAVYAFNFKDDFISCYAKRRIYSRLKHYLIMNIEQFIDKEEQYELCVNSYETCKKKIGHNPSIEEMSRYWYINESVAYRIFNYLNNPGITNDFFDEEKVLYEFEEDKILKDIETAEIRDLAIKSCLTKRQKEVLLFHYGFYNGESYDYSEMARNLNSHRQVYSKANINLIKRLKKIITE